MTRRPRVVRARATRSWLPGQMSNYDGPLLLDTHIWIWYVNGDDSRWPGGVTSLLERSGNAASLLVSDISYWEVAVKAAKGKLSLSVDVDVWLQRAERAPGIQPLPLDRQILLQSVRLPGTTHNDPADRMLIAAAQINNVPLVTADRRIVEYAARHPGTPVVDARLGF